MERVSTLLGRLMQACHDLSCVPLVILVVITTADVIARYALASSVPDTIEISGLMLGLLISLALAPVTYEDRQVGIEGLRAILPPKLRIGADAFVRLAGASIFGLMGWQAVERSAYSFQIGEYVGALEIQLWPVKSVFAFGALLTCLGLIILLVRSFRRPPDRQS
jgi:TRAP-type C4-dicarboxylate transport system permease small subunit